VARGFGRIHRRTLSGLTVTVTGSAADGTLAVQVTVMVGNTGPVNESEVVQECAADVAVIGSMPTSTLSAFSGMSINHDTLDEVVDTWRQRSVRQRPPNVPFRSNTSVHLERRRLLARDDRHGEVPGSSASAVQPG
jgi:hypothetical protein